MTPYLRALAARPRGLFDGRKAAQELDEEIEGRLRLLAESYVRQGMTEAERSGPASRKKVLVCDKCGVENWNLASEGKPHDPVSMFRVELPGSY